MTKVYLRRTEHSYILYPGNECTNYHPCDSIKGRSAAGTGSESGLEFDVAKVALCVQAGRPGSETGMGEQPFEGYVVSRKLSYGVEE